MSRAYASVVVVIMLWSGLAPALAEESRIVAPGALEAMGVSPLELPDGVRVVPPLELTPAQEAAGRQRLEELFGPSSDRAIAIIDDFEDGNLDSWVDMSGGCIGVVSAWAEAPGADGSNYAMRIDGCCEDPLGANHFRGRMFDIGGFAATGVRLSVRSASTSNADGYVVLGDDDIEDNSGVVFMYATESGVWGVYSNGMLYDCGPYVADQWYDLTFVVDWPCQVFDVYVDGVLKHDNVPFRSPATTSFTQIHLYNYDSSSAQWDTIIMSSPPPSLRIFGDDFERGRTCHWSSSVGEF